MILPLPRHSVGHNDRVFVYSPEGDQGRNTVAIGLLHTLSHQYSTIAAFQPIGTADSMIIDLVLQAYRSLQQPVSCETAVDSVGLQSSQFYLDDSLSRREIIAKFYETSRIKNADYVVGIGSDYSTIIHPTSMRTNALLACDLQMPVLITVNGEHRTAHEIAETIKACIRTVQEEGVPVLGAFVSPCPETVHDNVQLELLDFAIPVWFIPQLQNPENPTLDDYLQAYYQGVTDDSLLKILGKNSPDLPITPACFQYTLMHLTKRDQKTIVLPEGMDDRILTAANFVLQHHMAHIILLGPEDRIRRHASNLGLPFIKDATIWSLEDPELRQKMLPALLQARKSRHLTTEEAESLLEDPSYFGTMLIYLGLADGMVSGAIHSTANTVRPALQIIKTCPESTIVSGSMLMCLPKRIDIFADIALIPNPTASQLAEIAYQTAITARQVGIDPIIGFLSYATIASANGPSVDLVREAVSITEQRYPDLKIIGPIQFDAAFDPTVAKIKAPDNPYAGHVNTFIAPDLNTGNVLYKAIERTSGAVAIGPVLQGLKQPINDLSRGSTSWDIVNTIAMTAIAAQK